MKPSSEPIPVTPSTGVNLPNLLTWGRVVAIPLLVAVFYLPISPITQNWLATGIFLLAAITDWLDGYLARRLGQMTAFGAFLDPVADKLLVCAALVVLVSLGRVEALVALVIIGLEIPVSALREWLAKIGQSTSVAVQGIGIIKNAVQLQALPVCTLVHSVYGYQLMTLWRFWLCVA